MELDEVFSRIRAAYVSSRSAGSIGHFVATCAAYYGMDARLLDNSRIVEHAECYARVLTGSTR